MCKQEVFEFQGHKGRKVLASFDGGHLSSDGGGALLFRELELRTGVIRRLSGCFEDKRDPDLIEHSVEELLRQRIGALSMGYEDLNDHDSLRYDPAHALMAGKVDIEVNSLELPVRRFKEFDYRTLDSWSRPRRVVGKAEVLDRGENPRFIVTNFKPDAFEARSLYEDFYCARGDMENRIKEQQQDLFADRTSTKAMPSNQLRLWFSAFAHLMLSQLQSAVLRGTRLEKATIGTLRLRLFKIAARVKVSFRRVRFELAGGCPDQDVFAQVWKNLQAWPS